MSNEQQTASTGVNRAKLYQLVLFPLNNGATNVYYVLILSYIATFGNNVLGIATVFASVMVTGMRVFDAITDPIIGALMDRTNGKLGKFRPFMIIGNAIMALSVIVLYMITPSIPKDMQWLRYVAFVGLYAVWVIGYTFQTSVTRSGQTVLTNDPKQRPLFTIFNTVGSMAGMGLMQFLAPIVRSNVADYDSANFYAFLTPIGIIVSIYVMYGRETFSRQCKKIVYALFSPKRANLILHLGNKSNEIFGGFVIGKIIDSIIIGIICFVVLSIMKMPYTVLVSVIIGVTNVIPFFGPFIGAIPCSILILLNDPKMGIYFIIFILVLQQFDGNILGPKILGDSTGLSSFWVLFSILLFGGLFGFVGMILAVPVTAVIFDLIAKLQYYHLRKKGLSPDTRDYKELKIIDEHSKKYIN